MNLRAGIVHGAGYAGRELIMLVNAHPFLDLSLVSSDWKAGEDLWSVHPHLRGSTNLQFSSVVVQDLLDLDVVLFAGQHGSSFEAVRELLESGFGGTLVDLTSDFRYETPEGHAEWTGKEHPYPELLDDFTYGLPEISGAASDPVPSRLIANPGCFATAVTLALWPLSQHLQQGTPVHVTALTGASGAGSRPSPTTHFPRRDGNVRAYKPHNHRHLGEVLQCTNHALNVSFVPVSGPWVRGIWGTAHADLPAGVTMEDVTHWFHESYADQTFVRLWDADLPEMAYSVNTPYCDLGWTVSDSKLLVTFSLDNLLKGAASQAIQNVNLAEGLPEETGLLPPAVNLAQPVVP